MSVKQLPDATAGRFGAPLYPAGLEFIQREYATRRHKTHPLTLERLREFAGDLKMISLPATEVKFQPDFATADGTEWIVVDFHYLDGNRYKIAFPKHEDVSHRGGMVSAQHVALYSLDDEVSEKALETVVRAVYAIFQLSHQ